MLSDPLLQNPTATDRNYMFSIPSNPGWDVPIQALGNGYLYYFRFDLSDLDIATVDGQLHYLSVMGVAQSPGNGPRTMILWSLGGPPSIGHETAYVMSQNLSVAPFNRISGPGWVADRIISVPTPSAAVGLLLSVAMFGRRRR